ncbi:MAG: exodeoxyribonuclease VII large subunit, partial [Planctomycetes bacterium]|nr:exodeoxyribonuclease VII large subunit [Planctomycetota bacterium]
PHYDQVKDSLEKIKARLIQALYNKIIIIRNRLTGVKNSFPFKRPLDKILRLQQRLDEMVQRLASVTKHSLELERERLVGLANRLDSVSPLKVLNRGYSITTDVEDDKPIKSVEGLALGKKLKTQFYHGGIISSVVEILK